MFKKKMKEWIMQINIWYVLFSILFTTMLVVGRHVFHFSEDVPTLDTTYVTDFHFVDIFAWLFLVPIIYIVLEMVVTLLESAACSLYEQKRKRNILVFFAILFSFCILWFAYLPTYWPGGVYTDTLDSILMALGRSTLDNHHPVLYTMIWKFMFWVTGAFNGITEYQGMKLFTVVQLLMVAVTMAGFIYFCYRKGINKKIVLLFSLFVGIFPLFPLYGISLWKDTIFALVLFTFSIFLYHLFSQFQSDISWKQLFLYGLLSVLVMFLRNNGIYVILFTSIIMVIVCLKRRKKMAQKLGILSLTVIIFAGIIQGPVYDRMGLNFDKSRESMGIPIQQVAYILATDGNVSEDDMEFINEIMPVDTWKSLYNPMVTDSIKFSPDFDREYFEENTFDFFKVYLHLVVKNPTKAVKAYLLNTMGFWDITKTSSVAYISNFSMPITGYCTSDYFDYYLGFSIKEIVEPRMFINAALFIWLILFTITVCLKKRRYAVMIPMLPTLGLWITIMIATPIAFSFRYVFSLFLCTPIYIFIAMDACIKKEK